MPLSDYLEVALTNHALGKTTYAMPTAFEVALYTSNPNDDNTGTEVAGLNYNRADLLPADWAAATATALANNAITLTWSAGSAWGTVTHVGVLDQLGNLMWYGALDNARIVNTGDVIEWGVGTLNLGLV